MIRFVGPPLSLYASAGIPQFLRSLLRQSNPSTLTAGLFPKLARTQPPFLEEDDGDKDGPKAVGIGDSGENGAKLSSPNRSSLINGLATLLGGDPQKNGGDEAICALNSSIPLPPLVRMISKTSVPAFRSLSSAWLPKCHLKGLIGWCSWMGALNKLRRRGFGQTTASLLISSRDTNALCWIEQGFIFRCS